MNERIRELWDKAATASAAFPSGQNNSWETQVNFMEKFAELLIQECIALGTNFTNRNYSEDAGERIAKNFGVEL